MVTNTLSRCAGFLGASVLLLTHALVMRRRLPAGSARHSLLNAVGAFLVALHAGIERQPAVVLLEGTWALISLHALRDHPALKGEP